MRRDESDAAARWIHLVNPSHLSFGVGVLTPRWLFVLAGATPPAFGRPQIVDGTLEPFNLDTVHAGDIVGASASTPATRWLIPQAQGPKVYVPHPVMTSDEIRARTQAVWDRFYSLRRIWVRSRCTPTLRARLAFVLISKLYRQMYANTGIATDSARVSRANQWARLIARPCRRLFAGRPLPALGAVSDT
jgi:hypothetical protein